jgi:hypothetical protein
MCAAKHEHTPGFMSSIFKNKCTRCRKGNLFQYSNAYDFKNMMKMNEYCSECGQPLEPEVGFYYGTGFVSYGLSVMICVLSFVAWIATIGISLDGWGSMLFYYWPCSRYLCGFRGLYGWRFLYITILIGNSIRLLLRKELITMQKITGKTKNKEPYASQICFYLVFPAE